jgi:hypothetical protein
VSWKISAIVFAIELFWEMSLCKLVVLVIFWVNGFLVAGFRLKRGVWSLWFRGWWDSNSFSRGDVTRKPTFFVYSSFSIEAISRRSAFLRCSIKAELFSPNLRASSCDPIFLGTS